MGTIKKLPIVDIIKMVELADNAYPAFAANTQEAREELADKLIKVQKENDFVNFYGLYEADQLKGSMRLHDYRMNFHANTINVGGIGLVAVDLLHKKEKVAKRMLEFFLDFYKQQGVNMAVLYPFRPDFYKKMGFGFGTKMEQYKLLPAQFPNTKSKKHLIYLTNEHKEELLECYEEYRTKTHGMLDKKPFELNGLFSKAEHKLVGYKKDGKLEGYAVFTFERAHSKNFVMNDIHIKELVYLNRKSLGELLTFFHTQRDQINRIVINTQDEHLHYLFNDARNGTNMMIPPVFHETNTSGVGIMYRVLDTEGIFNDLNAYQFGQGSCRLKLTIQDSFLPSNNKSTLVQFEGGKATVLNETVDFDVEVTMDISDFSSLIIGSLPLRKIFKYGLATITDESYIESLQTILNFNQKPVCMSLF